MAELGRIGEDGRRKVVEEWSPYLPSYVNPSVSLLTEQGQAPPPQGAVLAASLPEEEDDDEEDGILGGNYGYFHCR